MCALNTRNCVGSDCYCDDSRSSDFLGAHGLDDFEIFACAAARENIDLKTVERDFDNYLLMDEIPLYVRDWVLFLRMSHSMAVH